MEVGKGTHGTGNGKIIGEYKGSRGNCMEEVGKEKHKNAGFENVTMVSNTLYADFKIKA